MQKIVIKPEDVWNFYLLHKEELDEKMYEIAHDNTFCIEIYLTTNDTGIPCIIVEKAEYEIYHETIVSAVDAASSADRIYREYLMCNIAEDDEEFDEDIETLIDQGDEICEREDYLDGLVYNFCMDLFRCDIPEGYDISEIVSDCKEHFLKYIAEEHNIPIYRPMYIKDEFGNNSFVQYPYGLTESDKKDCSAYTSVYK